MPRQASCECHLPTPPSLLLCTCDRPSTLVGREPVRRVELPQLQAPCGRGVGGCEVADSPAITSHCPLPPPRPPLLAAVFWHPIHAVAYKRAATVWPAGKWAGVRSPGFRTQLDTWHPTCLHPTSCERHPGRRCSICRARWNIIASRVVDSRSTLSCSDIDRGDDRRVEPTTGLTPHSQLCPFIGIAAR